VINLRKLAFCTLSVAVLASGAISAPSALDVLRLANVAVAVLRSATATRHRSVPGTLHPRASTTLPQADLFTRVPRDVVPADIGSAIDRRPNQQPLSRRFAWTHDSTGLRPIKPPLSFSNPGQC
jgi:hypothetical protein